MSKNTTQESARKSKKKPSLSARIPVTDPDLFEESMTHRSWLNEHPDSESQSNERLEFLGDAVLELVVTKYLFKTLDDEPEGTLTSLRASLVRTETLAKIARSLQFGKFLKLSHGEELSGGRDNESLLANTFEAVVGAIYLSQGVSKVERFVAKHLLPELQTILKDRSDKDAKSVLQEVVQSKGYPAPTYRVEIERGPDHDKTFEVAVYINGKRNAVGTGKSKQLAQQQAASQALENIRAT
jgi:ribonuclease-3